MPDTALLAVFAALPATLPAEVVTLESPCCALPAASETPSLAFAAVDETALVASEVVDWARRWSIHLDCRRASRGRKGEDMVSKKEKVDNSSNGSCLRARRPLLGFFGAGWGSGVSGSGRS